MAVCTSEIAQGKHPGGEKIDIPRVKPVLHAL